MTSRPSAASRSSPSIYFEVVTTLALFVGLGAVNLTKPGVGVVLPPSPDKLKVRLKLAGWKTGYVTMVRSLDVKNAAGDSLVNDTFWYTLNQLPK